MPALPTRRQAMIGMLALPGGCMAVPALALIPNPDAQLIVDCAEFLRVREIVSYGTGDLADDPMWPVYQAKLDILQDAEPQTLPGLAALARVAAAGMEDDDDLVSAQVVQGVLRLHGAEVAA